MTWPTLDAVDLFLRMSGCTGDRKMVYLTYAECSLTVYCYLSTWVSIVHRWCAPAGDGVSIQLFAVLCMLIESVILLCIGFRLYHRRQFRDMHLRSRGFPVPGPYRSRIAAITAYHTVASNVFVAIPAIYVAVFDTVTAGDPFTYPFLDVLPVPAVNVPVYACKYAVYAVTVYIAHAELCFINTVFIHYVGVLECQVRVVARTVTEALAAGNDERTLKTAAERHQQLLNYFKTMKIVFAKPILMNMSFNCIYFSLIISFVIQALQGHIHQVILSICIASCTAGMINVIIYCVYGSVLSDLHDQILYAFYDCSLFYASKSFKKISLIMMTRAVIPLDFTVGYIFTINLNFLVKLLKISYTVLNMLLASIKSINFDGDVNDKMSLFKDPSSAT